MITSFIYEKTLQAVLAGTRPGPGGSTLSAHLMAPRHTPNQAAHTVITDIIADELNASDYSARQLAGQRIVATNGIWSFTSDPIIFGDPVTVPPFRYLVLAYGAPYAPAATKALLMCTDLAPAGGALEAVCGALKITPPPTGWFNLSALQQGT